MARTFAVALDGSESVFAMTKLDRDRLYGSRRRLVLDRIGEPCRRAELTDDGALVLQQGMVAQGYFDESGTQFSLSDLVGIGADGQPATRFEKTTDTAQTLAPASPEDILDLDLQAAYALDDDQVAPSLRRALDAGECFSFAYVDRGSYRQATAVLLANDEGTFLLLGHPASPGWAELQTVGGDDGDDADDDDLDFEMF